MDFSPFIAQAILYSKGELSGEPRAARKDKGCLSLGLHYNARLQAALVCAEQLALPMRKVDGPPTKRGFVRCRRPFAQCTGTCRRVSPGQAGSPFGTDG